MTEDYKARALKAERRLSDKVYNEFCKLNEAERDVLLYGRHGDGESFDSKAKTVRAGLNLLSRGLFRASGGGSVEITSLGEKVIRLIESENE